jgi:hypothetical protein
MPADGHVTPGSGGHDPRPGCRAFTFEPATEQTCQASVPTEVVAYQSIGAGADPQAPPRRGRRSPPTSHSRPRCSPRTSATGPNGHTPSSRYTMVAWRHRRPWHGRCRWPARFGADRSAVRRWTARTWYGGFRSAIPPQGESERGAPPPSTVAACARAATYHGLWLQSGAATDPICVLPTVTATADRMGRQAAPTGHDGRHSASTVANWSGTGSRCGLLRSVPGRWPTGNQERCPTRPHMAVQSTIFMIHS